MSFTLDDDDDFHPQGAPASTLPQSPVAAVYRPMAIDPAPLPQHPEPTHSTASNTPQDSQVVADPSPSSMDNGRTPIMLQFLSPSVAVTRLGDAVESFSAAQDDVAAAETKLKSLQLQADALAAAVRLLEQQRLLDVLCEPLGFSHGRPVTALLVHRCLYRWGMLPSPTASMAQPQPLHNTDPVSRAALEGVVAGLRHACSEDRMAAAYDMHGERDDPRGHAADAMDVLQEQAYWLCTLAVLLTLLGHHVPPSLVSERRAAPSLATGTAQKLNEAAKKVSNSLNAFGRSMLLKMSKVSEAVAVVGGSDAKHADAINRTESCDPPGLRTSEAASSSSTSLQPAAAAASSLPPAMAFRQSLEVLLTRTYGGVRDTLKKQLSALLPACIQPPLLPEGGAERVGGEDEDTEAQGAGAQPTDAPGTSDPPLDLSDPWGCLLRLLTRQTAQLRQAFMPRILIKCLLKQVFSFINSHLFNQLLLRPEVCCTSHVTHVAAGLARLDAWLAPGPGGGNGGDDLRVLMDDLRHLRQACVFLVYPDKAALRLEDMQAMSPALNTQHLYRLCTTCWDDTTPPPPPPPPPPPAAFGGSMGELPGRNAATCQGDEEEATIRETLGEGGAVEIGEESGAEAERGDATQAAEGDAAAGDVSLGSPAPTALPVLNAPESSPASDTRHAPRAAACVPAVVYTGVSGEVLEEMKRRHHVLGNGGLIVTFLLEEDTSLVIAPHGDVVPELYRLVDHPALYAPLPIPPPLLRYGPSVGGAQRPRDSEAARECTAGDADPAGESPASQAEEIGACEAAPAGGAAAACGVEGGEDPRCHAVWRFLEADLRAHFAAAGGGSGGGGSGANVPRVSAVAAAAAGIALVTPPTSP